MTSSEWIAQSRRSPSLFAARHKLDQLRAAPENRQGGSARAAEGGEPPKRPRLARSPLSHGTGQNSGRSIRLQFILPAHAAERPRVKLTIGPGPGVAPPGFQSGFFREESGVGAQKIASSSGLGMGVRA